MLARFLISSPTARQQLPQVQTRLANSEERGRELQARIRELEQGRRELQTQLGKTESSSRGLQEQLDEIREMSTDAIQLDDQNKRLKEQLIDNERHIDDIESENRRLLARSNREWFIVGAAVVMIAGINLIHRQTTFSEDTGIGLLFVGMLGIGVILISRTPSFAGNLTTILFGDALGVTTGDLVVLAVVAAVAVAVSILFYRPFLVLAFDEQKAALYGLHPRWAHLILLGLITLAIVGSFQTVGTLLVFGLLVGPPATAALLVRRVPTIMVTAAGIGVVSVMIGLIVSYHANTSGSATMAVVPVVLFFIVLTAKSVRRRVLT